MRISHLIEALQKQLDACGDVQVYTEGCDCWGDTCLVQHTPATPHAIAHVMIRRSDDFRMWDDKFKDQEYDNFTHEWKPRK